MNTKVALMYSSFLHDIGKIINRSKNNEEDEALVGKQFLQQFQPFTEPSLLGAIAFQQEAMLENNRLQPSSLAHIVAMAKKIASVVDANKTVDIEETTQETSVHHEPLHTIFNIVHSDKGSKRKKGVYAFTIDENVRYPQEEMMSYSRKDYQSIVQKMSDDFQYINSLNKPHFNALLQWIERYWSYLPSDVSKTNLKDISLYDHSKITTAVASCIYDVLQEEEIAEYNQLLFPENGETNYLDRNLFLLTSLDLSGIQDFIYLISGEKALKSLRTRSFYIEIMLEVIVDELLETLSLSRANLLYTGGGHAYLLLPNTEGAKTIIHHFQQSLKRWFISEFTTDLSISIAYVACSGHDLMNVSGSYRSIWQRLTRELAARKAQKYTVEDIILLNNKSSSGERECKECLRSDTQIDEHDRCQICACLIQISNNLRDNNYFVISETGTLALPFGKKLSVVDEATFKRLNKNDIAFVYTKNEEQPSIQSNITANLWMCDYDKASDDPKTRHDGIASYAVRHKGIKRLGVLRADVDNLGMVFVSGIPEDYLSLARTMTLSRQLSMFFKYELRNILAGSNITVIYSGGDDLFLIGAWDDIVTKAVELRNRFGEFTLNKLTFSAGIGLYPPKYPVSRMAEETGMLEDVSKEGDKNQVTLWAEHRTYHWRTFDEEILRDKLPFIRMMLHNTEGHGKSFVYNMLTYFREGNQINIARFAYLLARSNIKGEYAQQLFAWIRDESARKYFITALEYYMYEIREVE